MDSDHTLMSDVLSLLSNRHFAELVGLFASFCFTLQYVPQIYLNFSRKSVRGFSAMGIIIKHVGASFLFINSLFLGEVLAVVLYGLFNIVQHSTFMIQFTIYPHDSETSNDNNNKKQEYKEKYLLWLLFPLFPVMLARLVPSTMILTNSVKPITQILSHLPQLRVCYELKTTSGVALLSQHLNLIGGIAGLYMCIIIPPVSWTTYLIYLNSILQAASLYAMAIYYDGVCLRHRQTRHRSSFSETSVVSRSHTHAI